MTNKLASKLFFDAVKLNKAGYDDEGLEKRLMQQIREVARQHAQSDFETFWETAHPCHPQFDPEVRFIGPDAVTEEMIQEHADKIMACLK